MTVMQASPPIDTRKVTDRRVLHFQQIDDALADAQQLETAQRVGGLRCIGNWTAGQILGHLAAWVDYSYDGMPFSAPWLMRLMLRPMKRRLLYSPMPAGARIPRLPGGTVGFDPLPFDEGLARFRRSFERLKVEPPQRPHALFGRLTHEQWMCLNLRHAELHLSFLRID